MRILLTSLSMNRMQIITKSTMQSKQKLKGRLKRDCTADLYWFSPNVEPTSSPQPKLRFFTMNEQSLIHPSLSKLDYKQFSSTLASPSQKQQDNHQPCSQVSQRLKHQHYKLEFSISRIYREEGRAQALKQRIKTLFCLENNTENFLQFACILLLVSVL